MSEKKRQANFELLRIIAMFMVITLHYLTKGNVTQKLSEDASLYNHFFWLLEAFCNVAVNVYVLISGYFLVEASWHPFKILNLLLEILFYSILTPFIMMAVGIIPFSSFSLYDWMNVILPVQTEHYWFATAYIIMYMLAPLLAAAMKHMPKKQLQITILLLILFFSVTKSCNPVLIATDHYGYDFGWFICLFLIAGYIRLYGITFFKNKKRCLAVYTAASCFTFLACALAGFICRKTGKLEYYMDMTYSYNYILVLIASIALFYAFTYIKIKEGKLQRFICKIAPCTFGIYLLHENVALRMRWPFWLGIENWYHTPLLFVHMIVSVFIVFVVGTLVDMFRIWLFFVIKKCFVR